MTGHLANWVKSVKLLGGSLSNLWSTIISELSVECAVILDKYNPEH